MITALLTGFAARPCMRVAADPVTVGDLLFGFGIVLAGGCETGWMYRAVEGQVHYWWVGIGNVVGATVLAWQWDSLAPVLATSYDKVNLLQTFGPQGGLLLTYVLLGLTLLAVLWIEKRFFARRAATAGVALQPALAR